MKKIGFLLELAKNKRMREDIKAIKIAYKGYTYYAYDLCKETGIINYLTKNKSADLEEIRKSRRIKNKSMLESLTGFLVGRGVLEYADGKYSLTGVVPKPFTPQEQEFVSERYPGSEEWTLFLYGFARDAIKSNKKQRKAGFTNRKVVELWDSVMMGPLYSPRQMAVKELLKGLGDNAAVIDIGCGSGVAIVDIVERSNKLIKLLGIDNSKQMLDIAEERLENLRGDRKLNNNIHKVKLKKLDLSKDWRLNKKFDAAFCSLLIHHLPNNEREEFLSKVSKILKPGGKLVMYQLVNKTPFDRIFSDWLLYVVPSHNGFPVLDEYLRQLNKNFSKTSFSLNGLITVAEK